MKSEPLDFLLNGLPPRSFQSEVIEKYNNSRNHILIDAPCGSGKTAPLFALSMDSKINSCFFLFPLRTLAKTKYIEFMNVFSDVRSLLITGNESVGDPLLTDGKKIIVFTTWEYYSFNFMDFEPDLIIIDEAQNILTSRKRSSCLDICLFNATRAPRIIMSGFNYVMHIINIISPSEIIMVKQNSFNLDPLIIGKNISDISSFISKEVHGTFLIFAPTRKRVAGISSALKEIQGNSNVDYFHAGISVEKKEDLLKRVSSGRLKILISTTALAQGVDLPFSHIIFTDTIIPGAGPLSENDIIQIAGRAGRRGKPPIIATTKEFKTKPLKPDAYELAMRSISFSIGNWLEISGKFEKVPVFRTVKWEKLLDDMRIGELSSIFHECLLGKNISLVSWCKFLRLIKDISDMTKIYPFDILIIINISFISKSSSSCKAQIGHSSVIYNKFIELPEETARFFGISVSSLSKSIYKSNSILLNPSNDFLSLFSILKNAFLQTGVTAETKIAFADLEKMFR